MEQNQNMSHPIEKLMTTAMSSLETMIDVNTIIGDTVMTSDGTTIIPVSKVSFGFAAGGSEFNSSSEEHEKQNSKFPFGGGSGGGVNICPMAFLVVGNGSVRLLTLDKNTPLDKLIELVPEALTKASGLIEKGMSKPTKIVSNFSKNSDNTSSGRERAGKNSFKNNVNIDVDVDEEDFEK